MTRTMHGPRSTGRCDHCGTNGARWLVTESDGPTDPLPSHLLLCATHANVAPSPVVIPTDAGSVQTWTTSEDAPTAADAHAAALERGLFTLAEKLDSYGDRMDATLNGFAALLAGRFEEVDARVDSLEERLERLEQMLRRS